MRKGKETIEFGAFTSSKIEFIYIKKKFKTSKALYLGRNSKHQANGGLWRMK